MKIALISDTHDNMPGVQQAIAEMNARGVVAVLHCGDIVAPFVLLRFAEELKPEIKFYFVFGNNDGEKVGLAKIAAERPEQMTCLGEEGILELAGRKIFMIHESLVAEIAARSGDFDFCFGGHDHRPRRTVYENGEDKKTTIFVNPGNLTVKNNDEFYKSFETCFSIVDLETGEVEKITI